MQLPSHRKGNKIKPWALYYEWTSEKMVNLISSDSEFLASMVTFTDYIVHTAETGYWVIQVDRLNERDMLIDKKSSR